MWHAAVGGLRGGDVARSSKPEDYGEMLSIGDVAAILGVHPDTARRYAREGVIKARKLPNSNRHYVLKSELMEWLKSQPAVSDVDEDVVPDA
jgi:hypothetical protein